MAASSASINVVLPTFARPPRIVFARSARYPGQTQSGSVGVSATSSSAQRHDSAASPSVSSSSRGAGGVPGATPGVGSSEGGSGVETVAGGAPPESMISASKEVPLDRLDSRGLSSATDRPGRRTVDRWMADAAESFAARAGPVRAPMGREPAKRSGGGDRRRAHRAAPRSVIRFSCRRPLAGASDSPSGSPRDDELEDDDRRLPRERAGDRPERSRERAPHGRTVPTVVTRRSSMARAVCWVDSARARTRAASESASAWRRAASAARPSSTVASSERSSPCMRRRAARSASIRSTGQPCLRPSAMWMRSSSLRASALSRRSTRQSS